MPYDSELLSRVESPVWYRANANDERTCTICSNRPLEDELITDAGEWFIVHESCFDAQREDRDAE